MFLSPKGARAFTHLEESLPGEKVCDSWLSV
jgi:hypothetical protein